MDRRSFLATGAAAATAALARPALAQSERQRVLRFVPYSDLTVLDPIWTTADVVRDHGYLIYDTLYGTDGAYQPQPQLAEGHVFEQDGKICTITLRAGPTFHDGQPIRARDVVASLQRWMAVAPMGQTLNSVLDELSALDDRRIRFRLKRPFPLLIQTLAQPIAPVPFIMPERVARTDPSKQLTDTTGSGPFRFKRDEYRPGNIAAYERFAAYQPTPAGGSGLTAGPKVAQFDRIEWRIIPDAATAAAALQQGEVDWFSDPPAEILELVRRSRDLAVSRMDLLPLVCVMRWNQLVPPFDSKAMRQALLPAIDQADFVMAAAGTDPDNFATGTGMFPAGSPMASDAGLEPLQGPRDLNKAKRLLKEAGYDGQLVRLIGPTDTVTTAALTQVAADLLRRLGLNLDAALTDSGTVVQRRRSMQPLDKGGWSVGCWAFPGLWFINPATHILLRGNGRDAWFGWPTAPRLEALRDQWMEATDLAAQKRIAREIQVVAMDELPCIPLGCVYRSTAMRRDLKDRVVGMPLFWNIRRA
ncbi:ABC transporter substrate-binding protein [Limobrevibacterium gyesilva]|uniref:ABC transporter substrate-binding protein n=1 Tax=Limobrevibacterium gyesilva TaxID=2991712 RepID=A0AA41YRM1_9PROT|nr:ABC transporter substrate-binding protein [Limobrevibacterium gyesilva]MCW3475240.1 ABC transporter substrate-binding protein [Limobrevibacterium gyesilva]